MNQKHIVVGLAFCVIIGELVYWYRLYNKALALVVVCKHGVDKVCLECWLEARGLPSIRALGTSNKTSGFNEIKIIGNGE